MSAGVDEVFEVPPNPLLVQVGVGVGGAFGSPSRQVRLEERSGKVRERASSHVPVADERLHLTDCDAVEVVGWGVEQVQGDASDSGGSDVAVECLPVGVGQPTLKVDNLTVGGTA